MRISRGRETLQGCILVGSILAVLSAFADNVSWTGLAPNANDFDWRTITNWSPSSAAPPDINDNVTIDDTTPKARVLVAVDTWVCSLFLGDGHVVELHEALYVRDGGTIIEGEVTFENGNEEEDVLGTEFVRVYSFAEDTVITCSTDNPNDKDCFITLPPGGGCE